MILGTGTFGRVFLVKFKKNENYYALKQLNKAKVVQLRQTQHIVNEKDILAQTKCVFIVNLYFIIYAALFFTGPGKYSLDALFFKK